MNFETRKSLHNSPRERTTTVESCCWVYASSRHLEMYLYVSSEADFSAVPAALRERFGKPRLVMQLPLARQPHLARESIARVRRNLQSQGYHLQLPPQLIPVMNYGE